MRSRSGRGISGRGAALEATARRRLQRFESATRAELADTLYPIKYFDIPTTMLAHQESRFGARRLRDRTMSRYPELQPYPLLADAPDDARAMR